MEELKPKDALCVPDERHASWVCFDRSLNDWRRRTLDDHHSAIAQFTLLDSVPEPVGNSFATARNLLLYAWLEYSFIVVAELQAIASLELALKSRIGPAEVRSKAGLRRYMEHAIARGWWHDVGVTDAAQASVGHVDLLEAIGLKGDAQASNDPQAYVKVLATALPGLRNELAHGTPLLYPGGYATLGAIARLINQLWRSAGT